MGVSGKTSKITSIVAAICIAIYIMAIAFGAAQIIDSVGERRDFAEQEFYDIADRATSSAVFLGFMSDAYRETIGDFLGDSETLLGIIITGSSGEYGFERSPGSGLVWAGESPRFKTGPGFPTEPFTLFLRIEGQRNVTIRANYGYFDFDLVVNVLKNTLAAVLVSLIIAFATLIIEITLKNKRTLSRSQVSVAPETFSGCDTEVSRGSDETADENEEDEFEDSGESAGPDEEEELSDFDEAGYGEEDEPEAALDEEEEVLTDDGETAENQTQKENPQGLYSPRGNIGWEDYTHDRLASELHRCASFEQDLSFLVLAFKDLEDPDDTNYRLFADEAVNFFTARDLIFEKGGAGVSVIIPGAELEQGIARAEEFRARITEKLPPSFEAGAKLCVGVSSRSGRLVEAERLMLETETALEKAMDDPLSPVVAFKSDLNKYREYIKGRAR